MTTDWLYTLTFVVLASTNTDANRRLLARAFANNSSGETIADELLMFERAMRYSVTGDTPAEAFSITAPAKAAIRQALVSAAGLLGTRYRFFAMRNADNVLVATNSPVLTPPVADWSRDKVLAALNDERINVLGLTAWQIIEVESEIL